MQRNQRRQDRTELNIPILEFTGSEKIYGETINLSETGLCYYMPITEKSRYSYKRTPLPTLSLKSPVAGNPLYVFGEIVYEIKKDDFIITGLAFRQLDEETTAMIKQILAEHRTQTNSYRFVNPNITTTQ